MRLFERSNSGVRATPAGLRYYRRCIEALGTLKTGTEEMRALADRVTGTLRVGLMPTFTRACLALTLRDFVREHPDVKLRIVEGYSGVLTERVLAEDLDFAIVPTFEGRVGLRSRLLARDREMLLSGPARGFAPLQPLRLADCAPLRIVVPGLPNIRRRNIETYFQTNGVVVEDMIEMDAMIGTLEFVAATDWVAVLPGQMHPSSLLVPVGGGGLIAGVAVAVKQQRPEVRIIGVIEAKESSDDGMERNDRLLGVAIHSYEHEGVETIDDVSRTLMSQLEEFFVSYNKQRGKKFKILGTSGPRRAIKCIKDGMQAHKNKNKKDKSGTK